MTTQTIIHLTPDELADIIEKSVKKAMASRPITRQEAAYLLGKSTDTIARMERRGTIKRVNLTGQPRYLESDIIALKNDGKPVI